MKKNKNELIKNFFGFSNKEMKYYIKEHRNKIAMTAIPRKNAVTVINKLFKNNQIIIITSRSNSTYGDSYNITKRWLGENKIYYNKLITNINNKGIICKKEKLDLFIDDQLDNCLSVKSKGIKVIRFSDEIYDNLVNTNKWLDIAKIIKNGNQ